MTEDGISGEVRLEPVRRALAGIRFGSVEIVVHDSKIVQIERREKIRLEREEASFNKTRRH